MEGGLGGQGGTSGPKNATFKGYRDRVWRLGEYVLGSLSWAQNELRCSTVVHGGLNAKQIIYIAKCCLKVPSSGSHPSICV